MTQPSHKIKESCEFCADLVCGMEAYVYLGTLVESKLKAGQKIKEPSIRGGATTRDADAMDVGAMHKGGAKNVYQDVDGFL